MARTKTYQQIISEAEQALIEKTERERPTVEDRLKAQAALDAAEDEHLDASGDLEAIVSSWRSETEADASLEAYTAASAAVVRAEHRFEAAKARLNGVERRMAANTSDKIDPSLAELVAEVVRVAMPGVSVVSTFLRQPLDPPSAARPVVVVNVDESREMPDGRREGAVTVTYHRDAALMSPLDASRLRDVVADVVGTRGMIRFPGAMKAHGVRTTHPTPGSAKDVLNLKYVAGYAGRPRLSQIGEGPFVAPGLALSLARELSETGQSPVAPEIRQPHYLAGRFRVATHSEAVVSEQVTDGVRTLVLEPVVLVQRDSTGSRDLSRTIETVVAGLKGRFFPTAGVVTNVERLGDKIEPSAASAFVSGRLPVHASAPHGFETVVQVHLRLTLESSTN